MQQAKQVSLFIAITAWAILIGGILYAHIVYFPPYLSHLPESNTLITGPFGLREESFWMRIHPFAILATIAALLLNWKIKARRKFILIATIIYALVIIATATYFLPGLLAFAESGNSSTVTAAEWYQRGQTWQYLSWIRGAFMFAGFILLLVALTKSEMLLRKSPPAN